MKRARKVLAVLAAAILLPLVQAHGQGQLWGGWEGSDAGERFALFLDQEGDFILILDSEGQEYAFTGTYSQAEGNLDLFFAPGGGKERFFVELQNGQLHLQQEGEGIWGTLNPLPWNAPAGIPGLWVEEGSDPAYMLNAGADNRFSLDSVSGETVAAGKYVQFGDALYFLFSDGFWLRGVAGAGSLYMEDRQAGSAFTMIRKEGTPALQATEEPLPAWLTDATPGPVPTPTPAPEKGLTGRWRSETEGEVALILRFGEDGHFSFAYERDGAEEILLAGTYSMDGFDLTLRHEDGEEEQFQAILMGDLMLLVEPDEETPMTFQRTQETAAGNDPAVVGTWGFGEGADYAEYTFDRGGTWSLVFPADEGAGAHGLWTTSQGYLDMLSGEKSVRAAYRVDEKGLNLSLEGEESFALTAKSGPLVRQAPVSGPTSPGSDPDLVGTWGGFIDDLYTDWSFFGDGRFAGFVPKAEELSNRGTWMAVGGKLITLTADGSLQFSYRFEEGVLVLEGPLQLKLYPMSGPLVRLAAPGE